MARWGAPWGLAAPWGIEPRPGPAELCTFSDGRVLVQMGDAPDNRNLRDLICDLVFDNGTFQDVSGDVRDAFDVDHAQGVQLDAIGSTVGLQRQGFDDNDYRRFLDIQIDLLLSAARDEAEWTGTHQNILKITRTFIGTGVPDPIVLISLPPYGFLLSVPGITVADMEMLANFIRTAIYAGVLGQAIAVLASDSLWGSASIAITDGGIWGSASVVVAPSSIWGHAVVI